MIQRSNPPKGGAGRARILDSSDPLVSHPLLASRAEANEPARVRSRPRVCIKAPSVAHSKIISGSTARIFVLAAVGGSGGGGGGQERRGCCACTRERARARARDGAGRRDPAAEQLARGAQRRGLSRAREELPAAADWARGACAGVAQAAARRHRRAQATARGARARLGPYFQKCCLSVAWRASRLATPALTVL